MIRLARPEVKIIACEPESAAMLSGKPWAPHKIQGWTPNFLPAALNSRGGRTARPGHGYRGDRGIARARTARKASSAGFPQGRTFAAALKVEKNQSRISRPRDAAGHGRALPVHPRSSKESPKKGTPSPEACLCANDLSMKDYEVVVGLQRLLQNELNGDRFQWFAATQTYTKLWSAASCPGEQGDDDRAGR